ncbi:hypothetical protein F4774DRAFT_421528 [Daldinia eschscholtzii]|nr:hypothetical protein F4774DRAFT_421528 [Daldinia eschscholtzii]
MSLLDTSAHQIRGRINCPGRNVCEPTGNDATKRRTCPNGQGKMENSRKSTKTPQSRGNRSVLTNRPNSEQPQSSHGVPRLARCPRKPWTCQNQFRGSIPVHSRSQPIDPTRNLFGINPAPSPTPPDLRNVSESPREHPDAVPNLPRYRSQLT